MTIHAHSTRRIPIRKVEAMGRSEVQQVLQAVRTPIEPVRTTMGYRLALAVVAFLMVLLPLIYVGLIGLTGYGVYWHLVTNTGILEASDRPKVKMFLLLAYLAPGIVGGILVAFMFKPLFARRPQYGEPKTLDREDEPVLFEFVESLCEAVRAPAPKSILLDTQVNAGAGLTSSVFNPFRSDLVLVIGVPLVAGMTLRQFGGVLAHEFGHFAQGSGMRLGRVIDKINHWFAFVVFQRDSWDEQLASWSKEGDLRVTWVLWLARGLVWLTRKLLHGLMFVGAAMSSRLSREMEFDADRYEARFAGSKEFKATFARLHELTFGRSRAIGELNSSFNERKLVDDFFELALHYADSLTPEERRELLQTALDQKVGTFDTHPSDADRIASVKRENAPGSFQLDVPASILFRNFAATCRAETLDFYQSEVGEVTANQLIPTQEILARGKALQEQDEAKARVFGDLYDYHWVLPLPAKLEPTTDPIEKVLQRIQRYRERVIAHSDRHSKTVDEIYREQTFDQEANLADLLLNGKITVGKTVFRVPMTNLDEVHAVREQISVRMAAANESLGVLLADFTKRLLLPLTLLEHPDVVARVPNAAELWKSVNRLIRKIRQLQPHHDSLLRVRDARELIEDMLKQMEGKEDRELFQACLRKSSLQGAELLRELKPLMAKTPYPFEHADGDVSLAHYLIPELPPANDLQFVHSALTHVMLEGLRLTTRLVGELCVITETVETALGLPLADLPMKTNNES